MIRGALSTELAVSLLSLWILLAPGNLPCQPTAFAEKPPYTLTSCEDTILGNFAYGEIPQNIYRINYNGNAYIHWMAGLRVLPCH
jgi:hypothetical protein